MNPRFIAVETKSSEPIVRRACGSARREWTRLCPDIPVVNGKERVLGLPECAGAILMLSTPEAGERASRLGIPVINISNRVPMPENLVAVRMDDAEVGRLAARHVLEEGYAHARFLGTRGYRFAEERYASFRRTLEECGIGVDRHLFEDSDDPNPVVNRQMRLDRMERALAVGPSRTALFCQNDLLAREVLDALARRGIRVPEQVGVIGVDNREREDPPDPGMIPLTSVEPDFEALGRRAAQLLYDWIHHPERSVPSLTLVPGATLAVRASSRTASHPHPRLKSALELVQREVEAGAAPRVGELAEVFHVSDRTLLQWFRDAGLPPPRDHILDLRLERARRMIRETDLPLAEIAARCGFRKQGALSEHVKRRFGKTPSALRKAHPRGTPGS